MFEENEYSNEYRKKYKLEELVFVHRFKVLGFISKQTLINNPSLLYNPKGSSTQYIYLADLIAHGQTHTRFLKGRQYNGLETYKEHISQEL